MPTPPTMAITKWDSGGRTNRTAIAQGIKSGQMTAGEAARAEKQQQGISKQVAADRKANGGKLNASEKKQINKEQNTASRNIYRKKHNAKRSRGPNRSRKVSSPEASSEALRS